MTTQINMENFDIIIPPYKEPSRQKSWITIEQIDRDELGKIFLNKIGDILFTDKYKENAVAYARNVLDFLVDWDYVSWKQYDSVMAITEKGKWSPVVMTRGKHYKDGFYYVNVAKDYINVKSKSLSFTASAKFISQDSTIGIDLKYAKTDKDFDNLHKKIFGERPYFEEEIEDGYTCQYRRDGSRYFALPTGDERLSDFI